MDKTGQRHVGALRTIQAKCPICNWKGDQLYLLESEYKTLGKELDLKPIVEWGDKHAANCFPTLYYIWECPHCSFCGNKMMFKKPTMNSSMELSVFRKTTLLLYQYEDFRKVLNLLAEIPTQHELNFFQAIKRHFIAIYHLEQIDQFVKRDSFTLARYCLHLEWLYRDLQKWSLKNMTVKHLESLKEKLHDVWPNPPMNAQDAAKRALKYYDIYFENSSQEKSSDTEHQLIQLIGRLNLFTGNGKEGVNALYQSIRIANDTCYTLKRDVDKMKNMKLKLKLTHRIHALENFVKETNELIDHLD